MIGVLLAVLLPSAAPTSPNLDLGLAVGALAARRSDQSGWDPAMGLGLHLGATLERYLPGPWRAEVGLSSDTSGIPWGQRSAALEVGRLDLDLVLRAGAEWTLVGEARKGGGVLALAGPRLRTTRVSYRLYDEQEHHTVVRTAITGTVGVFANYQAFRFSVRLGAAWPWDHNLEAWTVIGHAL